MVANIWKFFSRVVVKGENKRKCLTCGEMLNDPTDKSTSNMIKHLKTPGHEKENQLFKSGEDEKVN
jgi:hypothetical protein